MAQIQKVRRHPKRDSYEDDEIGTFADIAPWPHVPPASTAEQPASPKAEDGCEIDWLFAHVAWRDT